MAENKIVTTLVAAQYIANKLNELAIKFPNRVQGTIVVNPNTPEDGLTPYRLIKLIEECSNVIYPDIVRINNDVFYDTDYISYDHLYLIVDLAYNQLVDVLRPQTDIEIVVVPTSSRAYFTFRDIINPDETFTIDWGDGTEPYVTDGMNQSMIRHTYASSFFNKEITIKVTEQKAKLTNISCYYNLGGSNYEYPIILRKVKKWWGPKLVSIDSIFSNASSLGEVEASVFKYTTNVTSAKSVFYECRALVNIPDYLFYNMTKCETFESVFYQCQTLGYIPNNTFRNCKSVLNYNSTFSRCISLTSIPEDIFWDSPKVTSFDSTFYYCSALTSVPEKLFRYNTKAKIFSNCFYYSTALNSIPDNFFRYCDTATNFYWCFYNSGIVTVGSNVFVSVNLDDIVNMQGLFRSCSNLQTVGNVLFSISGRLSLAEAFYSCSKLINLPYDLLRFCRNLTNLHSTFYNCYLMNVSYGMLSNCPYITTMNSCFYGCRSIKKLDVGFFDEQTEVIDFYNCFNGTSGLTSIPPKLFYNCNKVTNFSNCFSSSRIEFIPDDCFNTPMPVTFYSTFMYCTSLKKISPTAFLRVPKVTNFESAFNGCTALNDIEKYTFFYCTEITTCVQMFRGCTSLSNIESDIFNVKVPIDCNSIFMQCTSLDNIPYDLFFRLPLCTSFYRTFYGCTSLKELPNFLFSKNLQNTTFEGVCQGCTQLEIINKYTFSNCQNVTTFGYSFINCSNLNNLPRNIFKDGINVTTFYNTFNGCSSLTYIPEGIFKNNTKVSTFYGIFEGCTSLRTLPEYLFNSPVAIIFERIFYNCQSLVNVPSTIFTNCPLAVNFTYAFYRCYSLTTLKTGLFWENRRITSFQNTFYDCTRLNRIEHDVFRTNNSVTFQSTFYNCQSLTELPSGLFDNVPFAYSFYECFAYNYRLQTIPYDLFYKVPSVSTFYYCFRNCHELIIPSFLFKNNQNVSTFEGVFSYCNFSSIPSNVFTQRSNLTTVNYTKSFLGCLNLKHVPTDVFDNENIGTTFDLSYFFAGYSTGSPVTYYYMTLDEILPGTMMNVLAHATSVAYMFTINNSMKTIPIDFFSSIGTGNSTTCAYDRIFIYCTALETTVPFYNASNAPYAYAYASNMKTIRSDSFTNSGNTLTNLSNCFYSSGVSSIPENFIDNMSILSNVSYMFFGCNSLTVLPNSLFGSNNYNNPNCGSMFSQTSATTVPITIFDGIPNGKLFDNTFNSSSNITSTVPSLWTRTGASGSRCFYGCTKAANYADIPAGWK